ncbi:hypothetical protein N7539_006915 [Penicillium diatomitis]|uniref:Uncharacterized protein n=1 Tax=Penicillium diatomitis TaxID=2819901 RepID=A0A9W9X3B4_9EURO|nr:uncharacterized protein N7539_006915 [Penicillium diatomitis]KAJ5481021.1 hypothetical protein N7539_006915 [Penicillium diatomitis]
MDTPTDSPPSRHPSATFFPAFRQRARPLHTEFDPSRAAPSSDGSLAVEDASLSTGALGSESGPISGVDGDVDVDMDMDMDMDVDVRLWTWMWIWWWCGPSDRLFQRQVDLDRHFYK